MDLKMKTCSKCQRPYLDKDYLIEVGWPICHNCEKEKLDQKWHEEIIELENEKLKDLQEYRYNESLNSEDMYYYRAPTPSQIIERYEGFTILKSTERIILSSLYSLINNGWQLILVCVILIIFKIKWVFYLLTPIMSFFIIKEIADYFYIKGEYKRIKKNE